MDDYLTKHVYTYGSNKMFPHHVKFATMRQLDGFLEVNNWIEKNIKGMWSDTHNNKGYFVQFELEEDAVAFKLRWM